MNQKDNEEEEDEKKEIDNNDIIKLAKNMTTPILPKYKNIKESKELPEEPKIEEPKVEEAPIEKPKKRVGRPKESYKDVTLSEVREELKNKTLAELELLIKMI